MILDQPLRLEHELDRDEIARRADALTTQLAARSGRKDRPPTRRVRLRWSAAVLVGVLAIGCGVAYAAGLGPFESASHGAPSLAAWLTKNQQSGNVVDRSIPWAARALGVTRVEASVVNGRICLNASTAQHRSSKLRPTQQDAFGTSLCVPRLMSAGDLETVWTESQRGPLSQGELGLVTDNVRAVLWHTPSGTVRSVPRNDIVTFRPRSASSRQICTSAGGRRGKASRKQCSEAQIDRPTSATIVLRSGQRVEIGNTLSRQKRARPAPAQTKPTSSFARTSRLARVVPMSPVTHGAPRYARHIRPIERAFGITFKASRTSLGTYCLIVNHGGGCMFQPPAKKPMAIGTVTGDSIWAIVSNSVVKVVVHSTAGDQPVKIVDDFFYWHSPPQHPGVQAGSFTVTVANGHSYTVRNVW